MKINIKKFNTFTTKLKTNPYKYIPLWDESLIVLKNNTIQIYGIILDSHVLIMDIYTLARAFKPSLADGKDVYMYAGDLHAQNYYDFLKNYLGQTKFITSKKLDLRCLYNVQLEDLMI